MSFTQPPAELFKTDFHFYCWRSENPEMDEGVPRFVSERVGKDASPEMVRHTGLARYAYMLKGARTSLMGYFSELDIYLLLNANPQPWLNESTWIDGYPGMAVGLYGEYIETGDASNEVFALNEKVRTLDTTQLMALADVIECAWRSSEGPVAYAKKALEVG